MAVQKTTFWDTACNDLQTGVSKQRDFVIRLEWHQASGVLYMGEGSTVRKSTGGRQDLWSSGLLRSVQW